VPLLQLHSLRYCNPNSEYSVLANQAQKHFQRIGGLKLPALTATLSLVYLYDDCEDCIHRTSLRVGD
jgi:hypothetical protein